MGKAEVLVVFEALEDVVSDLASGSPSEENVVELLEDLKSAIEELS